MAMMGIAFSLIPAVMWPSVAYIVDQSKLGTAYGLMTMIQNIGLAGFNLLIGWSNDHWHASATNPAGYTPGMWMFSILGLASACCSRSCCGGGRPDPTPTASRPSPPRAPGRTARLTTDRR